MVRGGKREGAGRPRGTGKYGEPTVRIRVPESRLDDVIVLLEQGDEYVRPLYSSRVSAGFPSPADDYMEGKLDLNKHLIRHPAATFFVTVSGDSMIEAGIYPQDLLVVDRSVTPKHGDIVIAVLDAELTVKRLIHKEGKVFLKPENTRYQPIEVKESASFSVWGVVTSSVKTF